MSFDSLLFDTNIRRRLKLFRSIKSFSPSMRITVNRLHSDVGMSIDTTTKTIKAIVFDYQTANQLPIEDLPTQECIELIRTFSYDDYHDFLTQNNSIVFWFMDEIFQGNLNSRTAFCAKFFVSDSQVNRSLKGLKTYLRDHGLRLDVAHMKLIGNEVTVRMFFNDFYGFCISQNQWPFNFISDNDFGIKKYLLYISTHSQFAKYIGQRDSFFLARRLAIQIRRIETGHRLSKRETRELEQLQLTDDPICFVPEFFPRLSSVELDSERNFYLFDRGFHPSFSTDTPPADRIGMPQIRKNIPSIDEAVTNMITQLARVVPSKERRDFRNNPNLQNNLTRVFYDFYIMQTDFVHLSYLNGLTGVNLHQRGLLSYIEHNLAPAAVEDGDSIDWTQFQSLSEDILRTAEPFLHSDIVKVPIKVSVVADETTVSYQILIKKLERYGFVDLVPIKIDYDNFALEEVADVYITNFDHLSPRLMNPVLLETLEEQPKIIFRPTFDPDKFFDLYMRLKNYQFLLNVSPDRNLNNELKKGG